MNLCMLNVVLVEIQLNTRWTTLQGFQSLTSAFEKASRRRASLMQEDFEIPVKSDIEGLNLQILLFA